jgi:hypothetical protein
MNASQFQAAGGDLQSLPPRRLNNSDVCCSA